MNKAQQMLAKAGFPDTAAGRAAFHKQYPTPDSFFQVHGNQYKNGGPVMYGSGGKLPQGILRSRLEAHMSPNEAQSYINKYANGSTVGGGDDEPWRKDIKPEMYILDTDENGNPVGRKPPELPRHKSNYGMSNFMGNIGSKIGDFAENIGDINIDPQLAFRPVKQRGFSFDNTTDVEIESRSNNNANTNFGITVPGMHIPAMFTTVRANAPGTAGLYGKFTPSVMSTNAQGVGQTSTGQTEIGFSPRINLTKHKLLSDRNRGDATVQFQPSIYGGAGYNTPQGGTLFNGNSDIQPFKGGNIGTYYGGKAKLNLNLGDMGGNSDMTFHANPYLSYDSRRGSQVGVDVGTNSSWPKGGREEYNISGGYNFDTKRPFIGAHISLPLMRQRPSYRDIPLKQLNFGFADGGTVDALQLMGMPTPPMYNYGSHVTDYSPSSNFGAVQSMNNTYMHGYADGGSVNKDLYTQANNYNNWLIAPNYEENEIPMYAKGGFLGNALNIGKDALLLGADNTLSVFGGKDIIGTKRYSNEDFKKASHWMGEGLEAAIPGVVGLLPGGQPISAALTALQMGVDAVTPEDMERLQSQSGQDAAKMGMGLKLAGAVTSLGTSAASAGKAGADLAKVASTAPKTVKTVADVAKAAKYAGVAADAYNTAKDPNANWKDWTRVGLNAAGTLGSNMSSTGMEGMGSVKNPFGSMQGMKDLQKFSSIAGAGDTLSNVAQAGKAGMNLYNTGENIDRYGLNSQTGMQGMNAFNQGLGAAANFSDNQNFQDFANTSNALGSVANFGMDLYNTANSGSKDTMDYLNSVPQGLYSAAQLNSLYGRKAAMGGAVNAPNMMQYAQGGTVGYNELDLTQLSKDNNLMDNSRLLNYNLIGTDKFDAGSYVNKKPTSMKEEYEMFLKAKPVTKYYSPAMPPHPKDGSMDPRGTVVGTIDPQTGKPVEINVEEKEGKWLLPNGEHFITTKKDTEKILTMYNNGNREGVATAMANIKRAKEEKEAKAAAEQQARQNAAAQLEAMQMQAAKYGGMVNQYGYGGGIKMYDGGAGVYYPSSIAPPLQGQALPASVSPSGYPTYVDPSGDQGYTYSYVPGKGWMTYKAGSNKGISLSGNSNFQPTIDLLNKTYLNRVGLLNNPAINSDVSDPIYTSSFFNPEAPIEMPPTLPLSQAEQNAIYDAKMKEVDLITPYEEDYVISHSYTGDTSKKKKKKKDEDSSYLDEILTAGQLLPIGINAYNSIFGKRLNYKPRQIPKLTWINRSSEAERNALKNAYAATKYRIPVGSGYLAERTANAANYMNAVANLEQGIANANNQGYMDTQAKNAGFTAQDIANEIGANELNLRALANQQNLGMAAATQLGQLAASKKDAKMYKEFYKTFSGGHYVLDKNGIPVYIKSSKKEDKESV